MRNKNLRLLFLGERRIAWNAIKMLNDDRFSNMIDIRAIVSNEPFISKHRDYIKKSELCYLKNDKRRTEEVLKIINNEKIDILLSIQHNWVLPSAVLDAVDRMAFNLHNAKLPDYKGYNSITHAILNNDSVYESTLHWMADQVDSGDIAYVGKTEITRDETAFSLYKKSISAALNAIELLLLDLCANKIPPRQPMEKGRGFFYSRDSISKICNLSQIQDPIELDRYTRALFFPPINVAYINTSNRRIYLVPENHIKLVQPSSIAINDINAEG